MGFSWFKRKIFFFYALCMHKNTQIALMVQLTFSCSRFYPGISYGVVPSRYGETAESVKIMNRWRECDLVADLVRIPARNILI
jgi:hypothetical protein